MKVMKVIIAGSRTLSDASLIRGLTDMFLTNLDVRVGEIVSGAAVGPDKIGETYAALHNIPLILMPADWNRHGKAAGPIRNRQMAEYADMDIVFWDGQSRGTLNMIKEMSRVKKPCLVHIIENKNG